MSDLDYLRMLAASGMPRLYRGKTFANFDVDDGNRDAFEAARAAALSVRGRVGGARAPAKPGLLLCGPTGVGKSHLAAAVANAAMRDGAFVRWVYAPAVPRSDEDALDELCDPDSAPALVLDDVGVGKQTPRLLECLARIVDARCSEGAPLVVTTNYDEGGLRGWFGEEYGARVCGRLREACEVVFIDGDDRRGEM